MLIVNAALSLDSPVVRLSSVLFHRQAVHVGGQIRIILQPVAPGGGHLLWRLLLSVERETETAESRAGVYSVSGDSSADADG